MPPLTAITCARREALPRPLALLSAEAVFTDGQRLGFACGVVLDAAGKVAFFIVRVTGDDLPCGERVLLPLAAVEIASGPEVSRPDDLMPRRAPRLHVRWTPDRVMAQPRFSHGQGASLEGEAPLLVGGRSSLAARAAEGAFLRTGARVAAQAAAVGAVLGALAGLGLGGGVPLAVALGVLFLLGGAVAGLLAGGGVSAEAGPGEADDAALSFQVQTLEEALKDRTLITRGVVRAAPISTAVRRPRSGARLIAGRGNEPEA